LKRQVADHQDAARFLGRGDEAVALGHRAGHRFFQEDVLAGPEGGQGRRQVVGNVGDDAHRFDRRVGEEIAIVPVVARHAQPLLDFPAALVLTRANGKQLHVGQRGNHVGMFLAEEPQADHAITDALHAATLGRLSGRVSSLAPLATLSMEKVACPGAPSTKRKEHPGRTTPVKRCVRDALPANDY
jgi:hypothetical protein